MPKSRGVIVTIHVFVLNRIGTDVAVRCMDLYGVYRVYN
jgi:hypothetical protein